MYTAEQWERMQGTDIVNADRSCFVNLEEIETSRGGSFVDRARGFMEQIQNPYAYRVGNIAVKAVYLDSGRPLKEAIASYLKRIRN